jgi:methionyl-tRNA formyltransferase
MNKVKVVFLGGRPLGMHSINLLEKMNNIEIVGCVTKEPSKNAWWNQDPHEYVVKKYPVVTLEDLERMEFDFGISINYWKIIPSSIINKPKLGFINLHHSYNLSYKGRDMTTHVIRCSRKRKQLYHGTTLHYTDDGLDTGPVIASSSCEILESDTAWTLFNKVEKLGEKLLDYWLSKLILSKAPTMKPEHNDDLNFRKNLIREIDKDLSPIEIYDFVRSLDFNNLFEPAFVVINGEKFYLTISKEFGKNVYMEIDSHKNIYFNTEYTME